MGGSVDTAMKVGALAKRTGLTVRTLHHYDEIGLLTPGHRTTAGHRLYGEPEVRRLQQIASLRSLGLSLEEVRDCLRRPMYSLDRVLELQIERIQEQIDRQEQLRDLIHRLRDRLHSAEGVSVDDLTRTIEVTMNFEKYYSPEQMDQLRQRGETVGEERIQKVQEEWSELFAAYGKAMDDGLDPTSDTVKALARKSAALITEFTGGDPGIASSLGNMYRSEGGANVMANHGLQSPPGLWEYMGKASAALRSDS
ncbi:MAG: MerR family transcriptional regulator [Gemmatimonadetes bacterium]|nr:MerR family transcriptional regulator [Gemmatimonadota bacterium]